MIGQQLYQLGARDLAQSRIDVWSSQAPTLTGATSHFHQWFVPADYFLLLTSFSMLGIGVLASTTVALISLRIGNLNIQQSQATVHVDQLTTPERIRAINRDFYGIPCPPGSVISALCQFSGVNASNQSYCAVTGYIVPRGNLGPSTDIPFTGSTA